MKFLALAGILGVWNVGVWATELVPERYLRPRDFNHHPFTDVGEAPPAKQLVPSDVHPYAILASKRPREGRQFPDQDSVYLPNPPEQVLPRKPAALPIHFNAPASPSPLEQHYDLDPYNTIPKNYAFSYAVKDKHSGDDFSHSQAHNGDATRGQYRVKLPDGRVQVVSYTADDKGYRADVTYEGASAAYSPAPAPAYQHSTASPHTYDHPSPQHYVQGPYEPAAHGYFQHHQADHTPQSHYPTPSPVQYHQQVYSPTPETYHSSQQYSPTAPSYPHESYFSPTPTPYPDSSQYEGPSPGYHELPQFESQYVTPVPQHQRYEVAHVTPASLGKNFASPSPITFPTNAPERPSYQSPAYATPSPGLQGHASPAPGQYAGYPSPSPTPYGPSAYGSPAPTPLDEAEPHFEAAYVSATSSPFAVRPSQRSTPAPFARRNFVTSTESSHILVTPRVQRNSHSENNASRRVFGARDNTIYRQKS